jgi:hypothetical protein
MEAPKLKSIIRNVRTEPRKFQFRSRHLSDARPEWEARKARIEKEVRGDIPGEAAAPEAIRFRRGRGERPAPGSRAERRLAVQRGARLYTLRVGMWIVVCAYLVYLGWKWAEHKDWDTLLNGLRNAGESGF